MTQEFDKARITKQQVRSLRRARRYIRENKGALARLLNTYHRIIELDTSRKFWVET